MKVVDRFLKYVGYDTQSDEESTTVPSTEKQKVLGRELERELIEMGLSNVRYTDTGYLYGEIPASQGMESLPTLGLIAHMDTSPDVSGKEVHPQIVRYEGGDIPLGNGEFIRASVFPSLARYKGEELIVTDGTTLLGADDKAGIAEIFSACAELMAHPEIKHRRIVVGITPDEEIGRGADAFDVSGFGADVAYTVDGGELGEIEYENFNAASARLTVRGVNIHPGSAKNKMKNAILMANEFLSMLPPEQTPAHTEGYEGFYHVNSFEGDETTVKLSLIIRDHDRDLFEQKKAFLTSVVAFLNDKWGKGSFALWMKDSYYNMKEKILPHMELIDNAVLAMRAVGVEPEILPIRGGTDGARLSFEGLPCPNLSTGGANFHGIHEFIPVNAMQKMVEVLLYLMTA